MPRRRPWLVGSLVAGVLAAPTYGEFRQAADALVLPAPRLGLQAVPLPQLDTLESSVAEQLREFHQAFSDLAARTDLAETDLAEAYGSLGQVHHAYEFLDAAEASYLNATHLVPDDFRWTHLLGYLYQRRGRLEEAVRFYAAALESRPDDAAAAVYLGDVFLELDRRPEARARFQAALAVNPDDAAALNGLGEEARLEGRLDDAVRYFEAALRRVPQASRIHYSLAMAYRGLGRRDQAQAHLQQVGMVGVRPVDPVVDSLQSSLRGERVHLIRGRLAYQAGQFAEAAEAFRRAVDAVPTSVSARVNLGSSLAELGATEGAIQQFRAAIDVDPQNLPAHFNLGMLLAGQGDHADAIEQFRAVIERASDDVEANRELARSLSRLGREEEAIDALRTVVSLDPRDEDSLQDLSIVLIRRGWYDEAHALLDRANRLFQDRGRTAAALARLLAASPDPLLSDGERALDLAMAVYRARPTPADGETVVMALAELGRCGEAADWQRRLLAAAERDGDGALAGRLRNDMGRYERSPCRPPSSDGSPP